MENSVSTIESVKKTEYKTGPVIAGILTLKGKRTIMKNTRNLRDNKCW